MNATARLLEVTRALSEGKLRHLIMGGHAVRHFGVDRNTFDFDFHLSSADAEDLEARLRRTPLFATSDLQEAISWRRGDFRRFKIGILPNGKEEWLEFWLRNHLLPPFDELFSRCEIIVQDSCHLRFLSLPDLIRSKETERADDWADIRLLEEILDERHLANASGGGGHLQVLSQLRSRRGFERAEAEGLFQELGLVARALKLARGPITQAYLLPFCPGAPIDRLVAAIDATLAGALRQVTPGSVRHLALVDMPSGWDTSLRPRLRIVRTRKGKVAKLDAL